MFYLDSIAKVKRQLHIQKLDKALETARLLGVPDNVAMGYEVNELVRVHYPEANTGEIVGRIMSLSQDGKSFQISYARHLRNIPYTDILGRYKEEPCLNTQTSELLPSKLSST